MVEPTSAPSTATPDAPDTPPSRSPEARGEPICIPDVFLPYTELAKYLLEAAKTFTHLRLANISDEESVVFTSLTEDLTGISRMAEQYAREVAIVSVRRKRISRVRAAQILGVHQATIARWLKETPESGVGAMTYQRWTNEADFITNTDDIT
jgi:CRP-like cAMP-binding protein